MIHVQCPDCDSTLAVKDIYAGKLARCPICQSKVRIPKQQEEAEDEAPDERVSTAPKSRLPAESKRPRRRVEEEDEEERPRRRIEEDEVERPARPQRKPLARRDDRSEDIQEKRSARPSPPPDDDDDDDEEVSLEVVDEPPPKRRKKKRRRRRPRQEESAGWDFSEVNWFYIGLGVVGVIWLISFGLAFAFPPFALIPILLGGLLMVAGRIWFLMIAFQDEVIHGILCLVLGIYNIYYLIINFEETKVPFFVEMLGVLMILSGCCAGGAFSQHK